MQSHGNIHTVEAILAREDTSAQIPVLDTGFDKDTLLMPPYYANSVPTADILITVQPNERRNDQANDDNWITVPSQKTKPREHRHTYRPYESHFLVYLKQVSAIPRDVAYWHDDKHLIIRDKFPKSIFHLLVLPRMRIDRVTDLHGPGGINCVRQLQERGQWLIHRLQEEQRSNGLPVPEFRMGFHIIPSMIQLHLHVISQDFVADALTKKNHWNSFTTDFFVEPETVIKVINEKGYFAMTPEELYRFKRLLDRPLLCHRCSIRLVNMTELKNHLKRHLAENEETN
ncbi:hypothetical protein BGW38_005441 [Lunasporangiospora selenospora]|uniref:C2H2-type domain-containing protein n=1 Tax=Lunasporangiospora selenospora TaxID=979761 RepID=A0A9P6G096_9FUNG|nr:hypothetical protein BGW38_005441 [Lunasporangiospora selenospora]